MIKVNIWKYCIMKQDVTKFGSLKIDICRDTIMSSDAIYYHTLHSKLMKLSSLYIVIRIHHCISTDINFETSKFCDNLLHDRIFQYIYFNPPFYQTAQWYDQHFTNGCICEMWTVWRALFVNVYAAIFPSIYPPKLLAQKSEGHVP